MNLPSIAIHGWHNASVAVYFEGDVISVIEIERLVNIKNAGLDYFNPVFSGETILKEIYDYFKAEFGFTKYDKCILGHITVEIPQKYKDAFLLTSIFMIQDITLFTLLEVYINLLLRKL
jgi:hypothetical protein